MRNTSNIVSLVNMLANGIITGEGMRAKKTKYSDATVKRKKPKVRRKKV